MLLSRHKEQHGTNTVNKTESNVVENRPTGRRQISWLLYRFGQGVELGTLDQMSDEPGTRYYLFLLAISRRC